MHTFGKALLTTLLILGILYSPMTAEEPTTITPKVALDRLHEGNQRYTQNKFLHPNRTQESRDAVVERQTPFATILGCADSRVSPEIVFDQGIGDLFVVRVAGNVIGPIVLDSIDYSVKYLGSSLILVLGHEQCGAVKAVLDNNTKDIKAVAALIDPAVKLSATQLGDPLDNAIKTNIRLIVEQLKKTPIIEQLIKEGKLDVVGGHYHLTTGEVELLH